MSRVIMQCFEDAGLDESYIRGQCEKHSDRKKFSQEVDVLRWALQNLDMDNLFQFAFRYRVSIESLLAVREVFVAMGNITLSEALASESEIASKPIHRDHMLMMLKSSSRPKGPNPFLANLGTDKS